MSITIEQLELDNSSTVNLGAAGMLEIDEKTVLEVAARSFSNTSLAKIVVRQALTEHWLKLGRHVNFRHRENQAACDAYSAMSIKEFDGINARQNWANWRTVPRNLSRSVPNRPLKAVDLCCGIGHSTEVLAHYLPFGSEILGLEYNPKFVEVARTRQYYSASGHAVKVAFRHQSVLEKFRGVDGSILEDESIDLANCCGAVGHHFDPKATAQLAAELERVIRVGGVAMLDSGKSGTPRKQLVEIMRIRGFRPLTSARSCAIDPYEQICFQKTKRNTSR